MTFAVTPTRDSNWIATKALEHLGKASVDNPPAAEDMNVALDSLDSLASSLALRGIIMIADLDAVLSGIADELAYRLAIALKPTFGDDTPDGQGSLGSAAGREANLRRMDAISAQGFGPQKVSFW